MTVAALRLDAALRRAHARVPIDLDNPAVWIAGRDRRLAAARRLGLDEATGEQL